MKGYLIICSSPEDKRFADKLRRDLRIEKISVWFDAASLKGDSKYAVGVADAIKKATNFICIASRSSVKSSMVKIELAAASRAGVPVIMVAIDNIGFHATQKTSASFTKIDFREDYLQGLGSLIETLTGPAEGKSDDIADPAKSKRYVFLSYAEEDTPYMEEVKAFMSRKGYAYWEFQGSTRDYQANLALELEKTLRGASATLTILSAGWKQSKWSMKEFMFSQQVGIPTFLLRFEDVEPTLMIADILYIDFVENKEKGFQRLDQELNALLNEKQDNVSDSSP